MRTIPHSKYAVLLNDPDLFEFSQLYGLEGIAILNPDLSNAWLNPKLLTALDFENNGTYCPDFLELLAPHQKDRLVEKIKTSETGDLESPFEGTLSLRNRHEEYQVFHFKGLRKIDRQEKEVVILCFEKRIYSSKDVRDTEKELKRYKNVLKGTHLGVWQWNVQTGETIFSEEWANVLGFELKDLEPLNEHTWEKLANPQDKKKCDKLLEEHFSGETDYYLSESRMKHKSGKWVWVRDKGQVLTWTQDGEPEWMVGYHEEVTQYKERLSIKRLFIDEAPSAIAMFDKEMKYLAASNKWVNEYNLVGQEIIGRSHYEIFPNISEEWKQIHRECLQGRTHKSDEDSFITEDGTEYWLSWEVKPWYSSENKIGGIIMHTANITPLKMAQKKVFENQQFLTTILESINVGIVACDENGRIKLFNKATMKWHGLPADKSIPQEQLSSYYDLYSLHEDRLLTAEEIPLLKALNGEKVENEEIRIMPKKEKARIVSVNGSQILNEKGNIIGAVVALHNITERMEAEDKLRISEATFRENFEHAAIGMAVLDPQGRWQQVNKRVCEIVGYSAEELMALTFQDITHPQDINADLELLQELVDGKRDYYHMDKRYFHKKGKIVYIHLAVSLVRDKNGDPLHFIAQIEDISPRKLTEEKLKRTLAQMESLLEASTQVSIIGVDTTGMITTFNKGAENLLGYTREEMIGRETMVRLHEPDELQKLSTGLYKKTGKIAEGMESLIELAESNDYDTREWMYVTKNGLRFPVQLTLTAIRSGKETIGYLGVATDISEIKKAGNEIKNILKITKDQNDRLKNFAHIVSHNLRSHSGNFGMLLDLYVQDHPEQKDHQILKMLQQASGNLKETIDHLNEVTVINTAVHDNFVPLDLRKAISTAVNSVSGLIQDGDVEIINKVPEGLKIKGIPAYLESILLNFTTNAIKYRDSRKASYIKYSAEEVDGFIKLSIEDNGLGIDLQKHRQKLFGMYKTFHKHSDSRGIGLFITKNQIEAIGGKVEVKSKVNEGSTFELYLKKDEKN